MKNEYKLDKCYHVKYLHEFGECLISVEYDATFFRGTIITGKDVKVHTLIPHPAFIETIEEIFVEALACANAYIRDRDIAVKIVDAKLEENLSKLLGDFNDD